LLHFNYEMRDYNGYAYKLLTEQPLFRKFIPKTDDETKRRPGGVVYRPYAYGKYLTMDLLATSELADDRLRFKTLVKELRTMPETIKALCITCQMLTSQVCTCCSQPFCNVQCQDLYHYP